MSYLRMSQSQEGSGMSINKYNIINIKNIHILQNKKESNYSNSTTKTWYQYCKLIVKNPG